MFSKISLIIAISLMGSFSYAKKIKVNDKYLAVANSPITIKGEFVKAEKDFVLLNVVGAKQLVKVRNSYLLNSPLSYERKHILEVSMPLGRYLLDNPMSAKSSKKNKF